MFPRTGARTNKLLKESSHWSFFYKSFKRPILFAKGTSERRDLFLRDQTRLIENIDETVPYSWMIVCRGQPESSGCNLKDEPVAWPAELFLHVFLYIDIGKVARMRIRVTFSTSESEIIDSEPLRKGTLFYG